MQAILSFPSSLSRNSGNIPAEPPLADISLNPRRINPVSNERSCRNSSDALCRNICIRFFLTSLKPDNPRIRVSKPPLYSCLRTKSGELIFVQQSLLFSHSIIILIFYSMKTPFLLCFMLCCSQFMGLLYPLSYAMSHLKKREVRHA